MAQTSSLNGLSCKIPYQSLHSLNALPPFCEEAFFFTDFCFVASPCPNSVPICLYILIRASEPQKRKHYCAQWGFRQCRKSTKNRAKQHFSHKRVLKVLFLSEIGGNPICFYGLKIEHEPFFSQTFLAPPDIPGKSRGIPPKKLASVDVEW